VDDGPAAFLLSIHGQFRTVSAHLVALAEIGDDFAIARLFVPLAQTLHHHHHAEEVMLFPLVEKRTGTAPSRLVDDHGELTAAIAAVETALRARAELPAVITAFDRVLVEHLDREEALVLPVLRAMSPAEAWAQIHGG
jgi:iron-sulfur cluster repair protein YtfE (RIC family)